MLHDYAPSVGVFEKMVWTQELPNTMSHCRVQTYVIACGLTEKVCSTDPLKAFRTRIIPPLLEMRICSPLLLNLIPVHSQTRLNRVSKEAKGPFKEKD